MTRTCKKCGESKEISQFNTHNWRGKIGWRWECKPCENVRKVAFRAKHPERQKAYLRKSRYGITQQQYDEMVMIQCGTCALCAEIPASGKPLVVDHNHKTGVVRELLCQPCNIMVGYREKRPSAWKRVEDYVKGGDAQ